jgi:hypothetical protein
VIEHLFRCDVCDERARVREDPAPPAPVGWFLIVCSAGATHHVCGMFCLASVMERDHDDCAAPPRGERH